MKHTKITIAKKLTKKQAREFARIQSGILIYNTSGAEFDDSDASDYDSKLCYEFMEKQYIRLLRNNEHQLSTTQQILDYVRKHF